MECYIHQGKHFSRESMQEHHVHPQAYGGGDELDNRVWICSSDHDVLHRAAQKLYANKKGEAKDIVERYLPNSPARQERMWKLVVAVAKARSNHARSSQIPEAGLDAENQATVKMSLDVPDWLHHRLKTLAIGKGLYNYVLGVLENHAIVALNKPGAPSHEMFGPPRNKSGDNEKDLEPSFTLLNLSK